MTLEQIEWEDIKVGDYVEFRYDQYTKVTFIVNLVGPNVVMSDSDITMIRTAPPATIYRLPKMLPSTPGTMIYNVAFTDLRAKPYKWAVRLEGDQSAWVGSNGSLFFNDAEVRSFSLTPTAD